MTNYKTGQDSSVHNYFSKWVTLVQDAAPKIALDIVDHYWEACSY